MIEIVLLAIYFSMCHLGLQRKLSVLGHHSLDSAKGLLGLARFRYYTIADGIKEILSGRQKQVFNFEEEKNLMSLQPDFVEMLGSPSG